MPQEVRPGTATGLSDTSITAIRQRWLERLDLTYASRRATYRELEPGVHAVVVPPAGRAENRKAALEMDVRAALRQVPPLARGVRLSLAKIDEYGLGLARDYRQWMAKYGKDIAS